MTIEQLQSEKAVLKAKIEKALESFYDATGFRISGQFCFRQRRRSLRELIGDTYYSVGEKTEAEVTINPIEI